MEKEERKEILGEGRKKGDTWRRKKEKKYVEPEERIRGRVHSSRRAFILFRFKA